MIPEIPVQPCVDTILVLKTGEHLRNVVAGGEPCCITLFQLLHDLQSLLMPDHSPSPILFSIIANLGSLRSGSILGSTFILDSDSPRTSYARSIHAKAASGSPR